MAGICAHRTAGVDVKWSLLGRDGARRNCGLAETLSRVPAILPLGRRAFAKLANVTAAVTPVEGVAELAGAINDRPSCEDGIVGRVPRFDGRDVVGLPRRRSL
jgi:hypothetical protein